MSANKMLDYAGPTEWPTTGALAAMMWSLFSGPTGFALAMIVALTDHHSDAPSLNLLMAVMPFSALCIGTWVRMTLPRACRPRDRAYANAAIAIPIGYALAGFVLITSVH